MRGISRYGGGLKWWDNELANLSIVREFPDMFLEELSGLPPEKER
jgi:hypothetical protein